MTLKGPSVPPIPDTNTETRYQYHKKKLVSGIRIGISVGYRYWYDKNPNIGIGMKRNPDIGIGMIVKS